MEHAAALPMSLLRQLLVSVAAVTVVLLIGSQMLNIDTARRYLNEELRTRGETAAATLATVYARDPAPDEAAWRAVAQAVFASGAYRRIDVQGSVAFGFRAARASDAAPAWFVSLIALAPPSAARPFQGAHGMQGTVTVVADDTAAVQALWWRSVGLALLVAGAGAMLAGLHRRPGALAAEAAIARHQRPGAALARDDADPPRRAAAVARGCRRGGRAGRGA